MELLTVFDWNGTLFDDTRAVLEADNAVLNHFGIPSISMQTFQDTVTVPKHVFYEYHGCPHDYLRENADEVAKIAHQRYESLALSCELRDGARELLSLFRSRNARMIILSNHMTEAIKFQLRRLEIDSFFREILANTNSSSFISGMREEDRLREYLENNSVSSSGFSNEKYIYGDSIEEIEIGKKLQLTTIALTGGIHSLKRLKDSRPDFLFDSLRETIEIFNAEM